MKKKLKLSHAIFWIISSTMIFSGMNYYGYTHFKKWKKNRINNEKFNISMVVQTGPEKEQLKTETLIEILDLSVDKPHNLFSFDCEKAEEKLLNCPIIKTATVKKIKPSTLYIDYEIRKPLALIYDFENLAVDNEGFIFPVQPFLSCENLPEIFLNLEEMDESFFNKPIENQGLYLAIDIINIFKTSGFSDLVNLKNIDISRAFLYSYGKKEIILTIEEELLVDKNQKQVLCIFPRILRLGIKNYMDQLSNYLSLRDKMQKDYLTQIESIKDVENNIVFDTKVIDLRISKLAFIDEK